MASKTFYDDETNSRLTIDWTYDGIYFQYENEPWITISIGPKTEINEINKIDLPSKIRVFKKLCFQALNSLKNHSQICDDALIEVKKVVDFFV
jgi:hypothetical protein